LQTIILFIPIKTVQTRALACCGFHHRNVDNFIVKTRCKNQLASIPLIVQEIAACRALTKNRPNPGTTIAFRKV
jgi:hypothetical protein